jgi:hypothetical protein
MRSREQRLRSLMVSSQEAQSPQIVGDLGAATGVFTATLACCGQQTLGTRDVAVVRDLLSEPLIQASSSQPCGDGSRV